MTNNVGWGKMQRVGFIGGLITIAAILTLALIKPVGAMASDSIVVTPTNEQGWNGADVRGAGSKSFVNDSDAPLNEGAVQLKTVSSADKYQYMHAASGKLSDVTKLEYYTKQLAAASASGSASYQLAIDTNGAAPDVPGVAGFATLVYEPYWQNDGNPDAAPVVPNEWQQWDVDQGLFWSSRTLTQAGLANGAGGPPFYTLAQVVANNPDATVLGFGVNVGGNNPAYTINIDAVSFNADTYDFEVVAPKPVKATNKDQCKNGGYMNFQTEYKNQGQCVSSVANKNKE